MKRRVSLMIVVLTMAVSAFAAKDPCSGKKDLLAAPSDLVVVVTPTSIDASWTGPIGATKWAVEVTIHYLSGLPDGHLSTTVFAPSISIPLVELERENGEPAFSVELKVKGLNPPSKGKDNAQCNPFAESGIIDIDVCDVAACELQSDTCTTYSCSSGTCQPTFNGDPCDDGDACTTTDTCNAGSCAGGAPPDCDDSNVCTDDSCDPATGCVNANNTASCDDGNVCTENDLCENGTCSAGEPLVCEQPANECEIAECDSGFGSCTILDAPDDTSCNGGNGICQNGECIGVE